MAKNNSWWSKSGVKGDMKLYSGNKSITNIDHKLVQHDFVKHDVDRHFIK